MSLDLTPVDQPENWDSINLGELLVKRGSFNPKKVSSDQVIEHYSVPSHADGLPELSVADDLGSTKQIVHSGDVLLSRINPRLNRTWVVGDYYQASKVASSEWLVFNPERVYEPDLLALLLRQRKVRDYFATNVSGVGGSLTRINLSALNEVSCPLPPLGEQHRIVAKIEELFSELDNGVEGLKAARAQLATYRQSLLKAAFEGRLTEHWRRDNADKLETADQLLQHIREEREARHQRQIAEWEKALAQWEAGGKCGKKPRQPKAPAEPSSLESVKSSEKSDSPDNWISIRLDELVEHGRSCAYGVLQPGPHVEGGIPFVRVGDIQNGTVIQSDIKKIASAIAEQYGRTRLQGRELLISVVGAIGRTAMVPDSLAGANIARAVAMVPITHAISAHFIELYLRQEVVGQALAQQAHEVARKTLNLEDVRKIPVFLPPVEEQYEIVRQLEARLSHVRHLESVVESCLERLEVLRQSILKRAFEGKLVPQDPDDEPASTLLERIRAEQEEAPKPCGRRRKANA